MTDLDRFEIFTHVAKLGGITAAGQALGLSKTAISKQIKRLEQEFQITLFTLYKQRLQLTPQGEALFGQCQHLQRELTETRLLCQQFNQTPQGDLHIVAFTYFARQLIYPRLNDFLKQYPDIKLRIDTTEKIPDFQQESIDLALGFSSLPVPNPDAVMQRQMASTRYAICASPSYFKTHGKPATLADLQQHRCIIHASRATEQAMKLKSGFAVSLQPYLLLNRVSAIIECAKYDLGLIQLPLYVLEGELARGELIEVLPEYQASNASVYYYYPRCRYMRSAVRAFIDYFLLGGA